MLKLYVGDRAAFSNSSVHKICSILYLFLKGKFMICQTVIEINIVRLSEKVEI